MRPAFSESEFVEHWRADYEGGKLAAGYEAALFCLANGQPFPEWLVPMVERALKRDFITSEGSGRGGEPAYRLSRKASIRSFICFEVERLNSLGTAKSIAFEKIADDLSSHDGKMWTAEMVKTAYYRNR